MATGRGRGPDHFDYAVCNNRSSVLSDFMHIGQYSEIELVKCSVLSCMMAMT